MKTHLGGILPALVTPLNGDETLNLGALERLIERVYLGGVDGLYLCGSTGEGMVLPAVMRRAIVETALRNSPRGKQVIVHVGAWSFQEAKALAEHAARSGATAVSSLPPAGASYAELLRYYRDLAACTDLPLLAYYFPGATGQVLEYGQLAEICALPGVAGVKFTDYDLYVMSLLTREGNVVFNGRDEVLAAGLLMGANGGIGSIYNLVPGWFVELNQHARAGRWIAAREVQDRINDLIRVLVSFPFMPALKQAMSWEGIECGAALRPRIGLTHDQQASLRGALERVLSPATA
jgi:N-acetylneuraminate lyase